MKRSWQRSRCCWVMALLVLVALILVIALPAGLVRRPGPAAPSFLSEPVLLSATNTSMDFSVAVSKAAVVHYVLLPRTGDASTGWNKMSATDVQLASQGMGWSSWEVRATVTCCSVFVRLRLHHNLTVSCTCKSSSISYLRCAGCSCWSAEHLCVHACCMHLLLSCCRLTLQRVACCTSIRALPAALSQCQPSTLQSASSSRLWWRAVAGIAARAAPSSAQTQHTMCCLLLRQAVQPAGPNTSR